MWWHTGIPGFAVTWTHEEDGHSMLVAAHGLDHRPTCLLAVVARLGTRLHLGRVELVALGRTRLARLGTRRAGVGHERALVRDEVGREVAELRTVGDQVQGLGVLLLALGHLCVAVVERLVARAFARLARLQAFLVHLVSVVVALVLGLGRSPGHGDEPGGRGTQDAQDFAAVHDAPPSEAVESRWGGLARCGPLP